MNEAKINLKRFDILDELKGRIEIKDWFWLFFWPYEFRFKEQKTLDKFLKSLQDKMNYDKQVYD